MVITPLNYTYALLTFGVLFSDDQVKYKNTQFGVSIENQAGDSQNNAKEQEVLEHKVKSVRKY